MKTTDLTRTEMLLINGGASGEGSMSYGTGISLGTDSLLTLSSDTQNGDQSSHRELSIGKGIVINLFGMGYNNRA